MKNTLLISAFSAISAFSFSQQQIDNSNFETWETVASGSEPVNWNSFLTAQGSLSGFAGDQLDQSTDVRPGSTGTKSAHIFSNSVFGVIANGNLTVGKINMGNATPTNASNYNFSQIANTSFSEALTDTPDSLVFWVKYTPISASTTGKVATILHDDYEFRDGAQVDAASTPHTVATATEAIASTNGQWVRKSIPFSYVGPATVNTFFLITFTTSFTAGGGSDNDQMWIDDMELIYNPSTANLEKNELNNLIVSAVDGNLLILTTLPYEGSVAIFNTGGQLIFSGKMEKSIPFNEKAGIYFVDVTTESGTVIRKALNF